MPTDSIASTPEPAGTSLLVVDVRGSAYGIDSATVREIVPLQPATRLPGAPPHVRGVVNLRGQLLTVVDLGHRLTGTPGAATDASIVVIAAADRVLGLVVDDVRDVEEVRVIGADREVLARADGLLTGLGRLRDEVVLVIDVPELIRQTLA